uniref:Uncharacterized protein n=1 Tax=Anguilla anguilla TaxID=7936 RepID=A0A0E9U8T9_ANGAN
MISWRLLRTPRSSCPPCPGRIPVCAPGSVWGCCRPSA